MKPTVSTKQFYLLGENVTTAQDIEIPSSVDDVELRHIIASHFAIVDSKSTFSIHNFIGPVPIIYKSHNTDIYQPS